MVWVKQLPRFQLNQKTVRLLTCAIFLGIASAWILYGLTGRSAINFLYYDSVVAGIADRLMGGRASTPVEAYYRFADRIIFGGGLAVATVYLVLLAIILKPDGVLLVGLSSLFYSFVMFAFFEVFPSLIEPFRLHAISYYAYKATFDQDKTLAFREKPRRHIRYDNFRGDHYAPIYGIQVPPIRVEWTLDENGFRAQSSKTQSDIVVIGDSYMEYGHTDDDTFVGRLVTKVPALSAVNLGKAGYGPPQYVEVLKRFGLKYKPKYALLSFFEGNDIDDTKKYSAWKRGELKRSDDLLYQTPQDSFMTRYWLAAGATQAFIKNTISREVVNALIYMGVRGYTFNIHPDLALLNLGKDKSEKVLFVERLSLESPEELLKKQEWQELKLMLAEFKNICEKDHIVPLILYIPTGAHIYASYSSDDSGKNWLQIRDQQINARKNIEGAMQRLIEDLTIEMISLTPVFEDGAKQGKLLYYNLDPHWNSEGREIAATLVANYLRARHHLPAAASRAGRHT
jgi:hypothetical protein